jgi:mRNA-degrading endonuclease RelE of RelBE toxin-antitoxin system
MSWSLVWSRPALRDMKKLDQARARRTRNSLMRLAETGHGDVVRLTATDPPEWRLRVGDQRIFFRFEHEPKEIHVIRIRRRDEAY